MLGRSCKADSVEKDPRIVEEEMEDGWVAGSSAGLQSAGGLECVL